MKERPPNINPVLEILVATMNRTSLVFLDKMFAQSHLENLNILIVNQTKQGQECISKFGNIRVINTYDTGLSKSRNLAIKHAIGAICLIADDDVEYKKKFEDIIIKSHALKPNAAVITFKIDTFTGEKYKIYPNESKQLLSRHDIKPTSSIEISFKRARILNKHIKFNTLFGLGSHFTSGEEYLFLKDVLQHDLNVYFENQAIVKHSLESSTSDMGSNDYVKTVSVINYIDFKNLSYLLLIKYLFYLLKFNVLSFNQIKSKFEIGLRAIKEYKKLSD